MFPLIKSAAYVGTASMVGLLIFFMCVKKPWARDLRNRLILLEIYSIAIAFLSPNLLVFNIAAGLIVPIFANERRLIAPIFVFAMLTLPAPASALALSGVYFFSMSAVIAVTLGAAFTATIRGGGGSASPGVPVPSICLVILFLVFLWPGIRSTSPTNMARLLIEQGLTILLPFYIIRRSVKDLDDIRLFLVGFVAVAASLSTLAMYEAWSGWPLYRIVSDHFGVGLSSGASVKMRGGLLRSPGPFPEPLSFAFQLCLAALLVLTSRWMFRTRRLHYVMIGILMVGLFAPQSRGAWLGLGCGMLIYAAVTGKVGALVKIGIFVPLAGVITYLAGFFIPLIGNMIGLNSAGVINKDYRQVLLERGWEEAQKHLLAGQNVDLVMYSLRDMVQGEGIVDFVNTYLFVLLVSGLIGLIPFVLALLAPVSSLWGVRSSFRTSGLSVLAYVGGAIGAIVAMLAFTSFGGRSTMTLSVLMALAATLSQLRPGLRRAKLGGGSSRSDRLTEPATDPEREPARI